MEDHCASDDESSESENDEQPLVIKMLQSMLANKKTVGYRHTQNLQLPEAEQIALELHKTDLQTKMATQKEELAAADYERILKC